MHTTITVNGAGGMAFLSTLSLQRRIPRALEWLIQSDDPSIDVNIEDADEVADFIDDVLDDRPAGWTGGPPLLFSPRLGDEITIVRDSLLQLETPRRAPRTWQFIARGTRGRLFFRQDGVGSVVLLEGPAVQKITFVRDHAMTKTRRGATLPW